MSRSILHNWESAIEQLCGENANQILDIAQDIYNTGYVRGKNYMSYVIEDIKAEIEQERDKVYQNRQGHDTYYADGLDTALEIIDKHISGKENDG